VNALRLLCALALAALVAGAEDARAQRGEHRVTLVVRDADVREVFETIARAHGVNVAMSDDVSGRVSVSLREVLVDDAIEAIAQAAGFAVERRRGTYIVVDFASVGRDHAGGATAVRSFKIQYGSPDQIRQILEKHLSRFGRITALAERSMIVVEDRPEFLARLAKILEEVDREPRQVLLEAKVLEIGLDQSDALGVDWNTLVNSTGTDVTIGVRGLTTGTAPGLFFDVFGDKIEGAIEALTDQGRVRTLASPRLLAMEHEEAEVLVGERLGFRVTTTINQVTTESVEFIDSGVILRFTPSIDRQGRVLLAIHPEVSTGTITDGIPSVTTTEVTTQLLAEDGERIFIGGLIRDTATENRRGVPLLSRIPVLGLLASRSEWSHRSTETVVIVKPTVRPLVGISASDVEHGERLDRFEPALDRRRDELEDDLDFLGSRAASETSAAQSENEQEGRASPASEPLPKP
jgi:type II secretory pathway component GspD/PulD (secretin)